MSEPLASPRHSAEFVDAIRMRVLDLGISHGTLDAIAGWQNGYTGKLLADPPIRQVGLHTLFIMLESVGLSMHLQVDKEAVERLKTRMVKRNESAVRTGGKHRRILQEILPDFMRLISGMAADARRKKISPAKRKRIARHAAVIRWRDVKEAVCKKAGALTK